MKKTTIMGLEEKWEALIVYIVGILGFIFACMKEDYVSENMKFHYKQAGAIFIVSTVLNIIFKICDYGLLSLITFPILAIIAALIFILIIFLIIAIVKAFQGERYEIPLISNLANVIWK